MAYSGCTGRTLRVDLEQGRVWSEENPPQLTQQYLGGRGPVIYHLYREVPAKTDPLGPGNKLIFAAGLLTGHRLIGTGRSSAGARSPLTGACGESEAGGVWGIQLRRAGFDTLVVGGRAGKPVYLWIRDGAAEIRDAEHLWGLEVGEAHARISQELGLKKLHAAVIGPAGEKQVLFANIICDLKHAFGRTGLGAVMGAKRLKAIAVAGTGKLGAVRPESLVSLNRSIKERCRESPFAGYGTGAVMRAFEQAGNLPVKNYSGGSFPQVGRIDAVSLMERYGAGMEGCFNCPIRCKKRIRVENAAWPIDPAYGGPEYETLAAFGSNLLIDDLDAVCKAHEICNRYGVDTISAGGTLAFVMECVEQGLLTGRDLDGLKVRFGDAQGMLALLGKMVRREGVGEWLSLGSRMAAEKVGGPARQLAIHVKGLEIPYHEPRLNQGLGLHYSVQPVGADHVTGVIDSTLPGLMRVWERLGQAEVLPAAAMGPKKARMVHELGLWRQLPNHLGLCSFMPWGVDEVCEAVEAVTGWPMSTWKLMQAARRGLTLMRLFNLREGFSRRHDCLPQRFHEPPRSGPLKRTAIDPEAFAEMQERFYLMAGWDRNGVPTAGCLNALDLEWAADPQAEAGAPLP